MPRLQVEPTIMPSAATSTSPSARIVSRYLSAATKKTAAVVLRDVPTGWSWGWVVGSPPRMHVQPMTAGSTHLGRIDLEDEDGGRVFRPVGRIPTDVLIELSASVEIHRAEIEQAWTRHMAGQQWIDVAVDALAGKLMVQVYGGATFERVHGFEVNWSRIMGSRRPTQDDVAIDADRGELVLGARERSPMRVPLRRVVFPSVGARVLDSGP